MAGCFINRDRVVILDCGLRPNGRSPASRPCKGGSADRAFNANDDREGWEDMFDEMIDKGANVNLEKKEAMIDWLVSRDQ